MPCLTCRNLKSAFETKWNEYAAACSLAYYGASNQFAAYLHIEMERARADLDEHQMSCLAAANQTAFSTADAPVNAEQRNEVRGGFIPTAA